MRQVHHQPGALQPLALSSSNELVNDALRVIRKVTKLRLLHGQRVRRDERVPELEAEGSVLEQRQVADDEAHLGRAEVIEWNVLLLVMDDGVALQERPALNILPRNVDLLEGQGTKPKSLGGEPVGRKDTGEVAVRCETGGVRRDRFADAPKGCLVGASGARGRVSSASFLGAGSLATTPSPSAISRVQ
jgi:hypothetical protein